MISMNILNNSKLKMKGFGAVGVIVLLLILGIGGTGAYYMTTGAMPGLPSEPGEPVGTTEAARLAGVSEPIGGNTMPRWDIKFQAMPGDPSAQDAEADIDHDIFRITKTDFDELKAEHLIDCTGAVPAVFDGVTLNVQLEEKNFCKMNIHRFWRDSSYTGGDSETAEIRDILGTAAAADIDDVDGTGTTQFASAVPSQMYLVTVVEQATTDDEDIIPIAFLIGSVGTTTLDTGELAAGNIDVTFEYVYQHDALAESKYKRGGDCTDDTSSRYDSTLSSDLAGVISSSLTTVDDVKYDCTVYLEITKDGYSVPLVNELAESDSEKGYLIATPFGVNATVNTSDPVFGYTIYGSNALTGDVIASKITNKSVQQDSTELCGVSITQKSSSDAITRGAENLYEPSCFAASSTIKHGINGIHDKGARFNIPITISELRVDYDLTTTSGDFTVSGAGATAEKILQIEFVSLESTTDYMNRNLTG